MDLFPSMMIKISDIRVSIIIPVYNVAPYVEECIRSVMAQTTDEPIECIIVDDCGTDNSMQIVRDVLKEYTGPIEFKTVIHEKNGGLSAARNSGIRIARGEYLYFLDSDDYISSNCISSLWKSVIEHPNVDVVYGKVETLPYKYNQYYDLKANGAIQFSEDKAHIRNIHFRIYEIACGKLIRKEWVLKNNLYFKEGILNEDYEWHLRQYFFLNSYAFNCDNTTTYFYIQRENSIMGLSIFEERYIRRQHIYTSTPVAHFLFLGTCCRLYLQ